MADTGAPWNIPYAEPADLVRDWPALSEDVADAVAAGLTATGTGGIGSNVVQTVKTNTFSLNSGTFTAVTGIEATITPTSNTAKVLIVVQLNLGVSSSTGLQFRLTGGNSAVYIGDADGSRTRAAAGGVVADSSSLRTTLQSISIVYLDSPATTSATTYGVEARSEGLAYVNRVGSDVNSTNRTLGASSITVIEVAP